MNQINNILLIILTIIICTGIIVVAVYCSKQIIKYKKTEYHFEKERIKNKVSVLIAITVIVIICFFQFLSYIG